MNQYSSEKQNLTSSFVRTGSKQFKTKKDGSCLVKDGNKVLLSFRSPNTRRSKAGATSIEHPAVRTATIRRAVQRLCSMLGCHFRSNISRSATSQIESADFDNFESFVYTQEKCKHTSRDSKNRALTRWLFLFLVAAVTALVAVVITYCSRNFTKWKFDAVTARIDRERDGATKGVAGVIYCIIAVCYAAVAALVVAYIEPSAAGSGISEIKCILNGVKLPRVVRIKTLCCKVLGVIFSVSSGLPVGKEGPMIHSGAVVGAGLSQGKSTTFGFDTKWSRVMSFRNDKEKRDFVSCGAAAGVAAAFGAPLGGVLFSLEEGSSFWSQALTWRTFFCAMISTYVLNLFLSGINNDSHWGELATPGMFTFGDFNRTGQNKDSWRAWEIPIFVVVGILGGIFGFIFNAANERLTKWRMKTTSAKHRRFAEALFITAIVAVVAFVTPVLAGSCRSLPNDITQEHSSAPSTYSTIKRFLLFGDIGAPYADDLVQFYCKDGEYDPVATLFFSPAEAVIKQLFHSRVQWNLLHLFIFFILYAILTCVTYGIAVPSGLFVPSLLVGSAYGRFVGELLNIILPAGVSIDAGTYSLIGAAAMLGGMARMTISLAAILLESTGDFQYGLPLMIVLMFARWTGNLVNEGLYDIHIELRHWPLLEEKLHKRLADKLMVCDIMSTPPVVLREAETVNRLVNVLSKCDHNGFPVVFSAKRLAGKSRLGTLAGIMQRKHICILLASRAFHIKPPPTFAPTEQPVQFLPSSGVPNAADTNEYGTNFRKGSIASTDARVDVEPPVFDGNVDENQSRHSVESEPRSRTTSADDGGEHSTSKDRISTGGLRQAAEIAARYQATDAHDFGPLETSDRLGVANMQPTIANSQVGVHTDSRHPEIDASNVSTTSSTYDKNLNSDHQYVPNVNQEPPHRKWIRKAASIEEPNTFETDMHDSLLNNDALFSTTGVNSGRNSVGNKQELEQGLDYEGKPLIQWKTFENFYPRFPKLDNIPLTSSDLKCYIDLRPYMNPTPYTIHTRAPIGRAYALFRGLGLRHLCVVNDCHDVVGIVTRKDLIVEHLEECLKHQE